MSNDPRPQPSPEEIADGYVQFIGEEVPAWHFPMMNDVARNTAYDTALGAALKNGGIVLDIGTGSGLLAMMAARRGATQVFTCEEIPAIARKAREIIRANGLSDRIQVINRLSTKLEVGKDLPERADVLVTEIFDDGLLGEYAFSAIGHAQKHLLKPQAQIIPRGASVTAVAVESQEIFENHRVTKAAGFDVSAFNEFTEKNYIGYYLEKMGHRMLTAPKTILDFDFNRIPGDGSVPIELEVVESGTCHVIAYWYELRLDAATRILTQPGQAMRSSWKQAIRLLEQPRKLVRGERFKIRAEHNQESIWFGGTSS